MTIDRLHAEQARRIMVALSTWLEGAPGRSFRVWYDLETGWHAQLEERHPARGESLCDTLAQIATVCLYEVQP